MRITVDGKRIEQSTNRTIELSKWSNKAGKMKGTHAEARAFNGFLDAIRNKVHAAEREMVQDGKAITYPSFKDKWFAVHEKPVMLIEIFRQHNQQIKELIGKDYAPATYQRYVTSKDHTQSFLKWKYKVEDIDIKKLNYEFISNYAFWLKSKRNCNHNSTMKYLANFKKLFYSVLKVDGCRRILSLDLNSLRKKLKDHF